MRGDTLYYQGMDSGLLPYIDGKEVPLFITDVEGATTVELLTRTPDGTVTLSVVDNVVHGKVVVYPNNHITLPDMDGETFYLRGCHHKVECVVYLPENQIKER